MLVFLSCRSADRWQMLKCSGCRSCCLSRCDPVPLRDMAEAPLSYFQCSLLKGQACPWNQLPCCWMELLISAANAEVTNGFCTLGKKKRGTQVSRKKMVFQRAPRKKPRECLGLSARTSQSCPLGRPLRKEVPVVSVCRAGGGPGWL